MFGKIALVLLVGGVSVGGALALVMAQSSSVKRQVSPQTALVSPDFSTKPRIEKRLTRPVVGPNSPVATARIAPLTSSPAVEEPQITALPSAVPQATPLVAVAPAPKINAQEFGASQSEPHISPFAGLALDGLTTPEPDQSGRLGLQESPAGQYLQQEIAKTWIIGVYR